MTCLFIYRVTHQAPKSDAITQATTGSFEQLICLQIVQGCGTLETKYQLSRLLCLVAAALQGHLRIFWEKVNSRTHTCSLQIRLTSNQQFSGANLGFFKGEGLRLTGMY